MRKLLLATEAHKKREAQKARRQQVKAALLQAQAEELVCSRLLRATLKELEDAPTVYVPGYDGAPSSTRVDLEWNLGTEVVRVRVTVRVTIRVTVTVTIRVS